MSEQPLPAESRDKSIWRSIGLQVLIALIPAAIAGMVGYYFNEFMRDRKVLEVSSNSSGNLASMPVSIAGKLEILLPITADRKEAVKTLFRYDVKVTNKTEQGADDIALVLTPPKGIELVGNPEVTTVPPEVIAAITVKQGVGQFGNPNLVFNLINPGQSVKIGYLGFSREEAIAGNAPLVAVVSKKDWAQRNVTENTPEQAKENTWLFFAAGVSVAMFGILFGFLQARLIQLRSNRRLSEQLDEIRFRMSEEGSRMREGK